jgi:branched-chain amino acid transport system permease protein
MTVDRLAHVPGRARPLLLTGAIVVVALGPTLGLNPFWTRQVVLIAILSLIVSGLNLTFGYAGELALGQPALYATGAYLTGYLAKNVVNDIGLLVIASCVAALVVGVITGAPGVRLGGWMLAISSFFLVLLIPDIVNLIGDPIGEFEGLSGIPLPELFGTELTKESFYVFVVVATGIWFVLLRNLVNSPRGAEFRVLGAGRTLSASLGVSTYALKLKAYAIGAVPAGVAGCLFAYLDGFVSPSSFGLSAAIAILAASVLGGMHSLYGAVLGAALLQLGPLGSTAFEDYALVAYGAFLVVGGVLLPKGLAPLVRRIAGRGLRAVSPTRHTPIAPGLPVDRELPAVPGRELRVEAVSKNFGGVTALRSVSLSAAPGNITALIGPNGSGKTTLLNLVSGFYPCDAGRVLLDGRDVTRLPAHHRARVGVGRTFQTPIIPADLTVREVVRTGAVPGEVGTLATMLRLPSYRRRERHAAVRVDQILTALGLERRADDEAASLPLGTRRLVELARVLALGPAVMLLDEVASGLDEDEVHELSVVVRRLRDAGATIVLVEHNFDLIAAVADRVVVLAEGAVLTAGTPAEVAVDEAVRTHYLGAGPPEPRYVEYDRRHEADEVVTQGAPR